MKNFKKSVKTICVLALALMLALTAFGCGSDVVQEGTFDDDYEPTVAGKIKLQYYIASTDADKRSVNDWVAAFEKKYPNCKVNAELTNRSKSDIQAEIAAKTVGDVFFLWETDVYNYAVTQEALMPLDYYASAYEIDTSNVFSAIYEMGVVEGKLYMVMRDYNHLVLVYNKDMVASANLTDPVELEENGEWTWDTFKQYCDALTTKDDTAEVQTVGASLRLGYAPNYIAFLEGFGGSWYDTENKKVTFISDDKVVQGVNEMVDFVTSNVCYYNPTDQTGTGARTISDTASQKSFNGYSTLNQICFRDIEYPNFANCGDTYEAADIDWDVVSYPALPTHKVGTGSTGFAVFNRTSNPDAAAALCLSLYTEDGQRSYNGQEGGSVPNVMSLAEDDFWRVPTEYLDSGKNFDAFISFPEADTYGQVDCVVPPEIASIVKEYMQNVVPDAVNGSRSVADTLNLLETAANETWATIYND